MQTIHFTSNDDFCVFIEKRGGSYFYIRGHGQTAYAPGSYLDAPLAEREMSRLRAEGYKERLGTADA